MRLLSNMFPSHQAMKALSQRYTEHLNQQAEHFQTQMKERAFSIGYSKLTQMQVGNFLRNCKSLKW